jgi:hypothetical protein
MAIIKSQVRWRAAGAAAVLGAVTAGALAMGTGGSAVAAPAAGPATGDVPAERVLLCEIRSEKIRGLRGPGAAGESPESLRDAVWVLEERIQQWRSGAEGVPQAEALVRRATDVAATWREALEAHDNGQGDVSKGALARAAGQLNSLEAQAKNSPVPGCS